MNFPYRLIDLTHTLDANVPTWNGGCGFNQDIQLDYDDCDAEIKFRVMKMQMHCGIGTHMDAPSHCIPDAKAIHEFEPQDLCMPCFVIDVSEKSHEHSSLTIEDIVSFELKHHKISPNSCVMISTGWEKFWGDADQYRNNHVFPSVSIQAANLLIERGVSALGIDTLSPDRPDDGFKVHQAFLGKNKIIIENVMNLNKMPPVGGFVMILPIKLKDATEAPIRLIGLRQ